MDGRHDWQAVEIRSVNDVKLSTHRERLLVLKHLVAGRLVELMVGPGKYMRFSKIVKGRLWGRDSENLVSSESMNE